MRAFIIRPFGKKKDLKGNEIDFDQVANDLIGPALGAIGAEGRETLDIFESGNIHADMFRRLLTADIIVVLARSLQPGDVRGVIEVLFAKL